MRLAAAEYGQFATALENLADDDWSKPTDCAGWDVRTMASHVLGMAEMAASVPEGIRQMKAAKKRGGLFIDALTAVQVEKRVDLTPQQLTERIRNVGPKAARHRRRIPSFVRNRRMPIPQPVGDVDEDWTIGFLMDTILTRDTWMHRIDISRATERAVVLTQEHDGRIVAGVVAEWAQRHGKAFT
ncbi:MAG TPA: maleylpyruvate isomerase family mycothiol-dependent enzyme, partial [Acidothermaceae bacterium]|nr:maleylpyruvate isomerase family mycothiol-dependent enzyme [Acidothermaceae bacterium]